MSDYGGGGDDGYDGGGYVEYVHRPPSTLVAHLAVYTGTCMAAEANLTPATVTL